MNRIVLENHIYYDNRNLIKSYKVENGCVHVNFISGEQGQGKIGNNQFKLIIPVYDSKYTYTFFADQRKGTVKQYTR